MSRLEWNKRPFPRSKTIMLAVSAMTAAVFLFMSIFYPLSEKDKTSASTKEPSLVTTGIFTAYTSRKTETDSSPHITADGSDLRKQSSCIVANNKLKMGTKVEIDGFGICEVRDRMRSRTAGNRFDIYMGQNVGRAREFGKRKLPYRLVD